MPTYTKYPEQVPVDIAYSKIAAFHPWSVGEDMCVKILLSGCEHILVTENMKEIRTTMPHSHFLYG